ncbi:MAG: twin-arginine translocation signal domain-containing protein, partial [Gemmatimonadetes bacterium]|nr:twin-arginine translocation signal domain-containing protein [Gemmatimonadota bacterium]
MTHTRRRFLATSAAAGAAALTPGQALSTDASRPGSPLGSGTP